MIQLENVTKSYHVGEQNVPVLKGISLNIALGSFVALVGPSGCGKSTLLNLLGGLDRVDEGRIVYRGHDITTFKEQQLEAYRLENIGTIFQSFHLISHMSALENVEVPMTLAGMNAELRRQKAKELLDLVGLSDRIDHKPNQLSGGQKQRVAIARALALDPTVILADEPTGALDTATGQQVIELLREVSSLRGTTIIMVTHSNEIAAQADHIISMRDGEVVEQHQGKTHDQSKSVTKRNTQGNMSLQTAMRHAFGNLIQKKWRSSLVSFGASIGIIGIALLVGLGIGIENKLTSEIGGALSENTLEVSPADTNDDSLSLSEEQLKRVEQIPHVAGAYQWYVFTSGFVYENNTTSDLMFSAKPNHLQTTADQEKIIAGTYPDDAKEIAISKKIAQELVGEGHDIKELLGKEVNVLTQNDSSNGSVSKGEELTLQVSAIIQDDLFGLSNTMIQYDFARDLSKRLDIYNQDQPRATQVVVSSIHHIADVKTALESLGFKAASGDEQLEQISSYAKMIQATIGLFAGISLIVSSIMIGIVLYISVLERTKEIGVLRSIGARRKDIRRIFLTEAGVIGFIAGVVGVLVAAFFGWVGNEILAMYLEEDAFSAFALPPSLIAFNLVFSTLLSLLAGWLPARKASNLNPIEALRNE